MRLRRLVFGAACGWAGAAGAADPTVAVDFSTLLMSLALVVGFILLTALVIKRLPFGLVGRGSGPLKVVATLPLGPKERLLLINARGVEVLIAVSPAGLAIVNTGREIAHEESAGEPAVSVEPLRPFSLAETT